MSSSSHSPLSAALRIAALVLIILNLLALLCLPLILRTLYENPDLLLQLDRATVTGGPDLSLSSEYPADLPPSSFPFYLGFLYAAGLGTLMILLIGHRILLRIGANEPFAAGQAKSFRWMAIAFFWLSLAFLVKTFAYITLLTLFCCLLFFFFGLVCLILADVFRQAWQVKSENELTI
jgi:hypothetical protein